MLYAEMAFSRAIRPPLLSDWESARVLRFSNRERRARWLAGRALAKAVVREALELSGVIDIREGVDGEPLLYRDGFPAIDVWLSIECRHDRVVAVVSRRAVGVDIRRVGNGEAAMVERFIGRSDQRNLRRVIGSVGDSRSAGWAIKAAGLRALRHRFPGRAGDLNALTIGADLAIDSPAGQLQTIALRIHSHIAIAVAGHVASPADHVAKVVLDQPPAAPRDEPSALQGAIDRSLARARRLADARMRWHRLRWQT